MARPATEEFIEYERADGSEKLWRGSLLSSLW